MQCVHFSEHNSFSFKPISSIWFHPSIKPFSNSPLACPRDLWQAIFFLENSGFLLATLPCTAWLLSVLLMVGSWTITLAKVRKTFSCLEDTLGTFATSQTVTRSALEWSLLVDHFSERKRWSWISSICTQSVWLCLWSPNSLEMVL